MEKTIIKRGSVHLKRIYFGKKDSEDFITISADDPTLFDKFANGYKKVIELSDDVDKKIDEIKEPPDGEENIAANMEYATAVSRENVRFSVEAVKIVDEIFGEGTIKKYFSDIYAEIPDFIPGVDCIMDFFDNITPDMEETFSKNLAEREKTRKAKMAKYIPQDHKKPGGRR